MEDAWTTAADMGPPSGAGAISIPTSDVVMSNGGGVHGDDGNWPASRGDHSPGRGGVDGARRSRSRSPGAREGGDRGREITNNPGNNLHVSGLSSRVDTRDLEAAFAKVGRVQKASVMYDPHTRESRGFGFVTMETVEEAEAAVTALNATDFMGKTITVEKARRGRARTPTPGRYYGPPKRFEHERPYDPRPYDSRYSRDHDRRRGGGGGGGGGYDDRRDRYDRYDDRYRDYERMDRRDYDRYERDRYGYDRRYDDRRY